MNHSLHCLDNTGCEADRSVGGDSSWRFACLFQRENGAFFQIPGTTPLEKLSLKMDSSSVLAVGPSALRKVGGSQKAVGWGEPESDMMRFQALAGSGLPSRSARNSSHLALRASSESRLTSPHAARYSTRFDCTVRLWV